MNEPLLGEAFSLLESDVFAWTDAARHFTRVADTVNGTIAAEWKVLAAVYNERATLVRQSLAALKPNNLDGAR